MSSGAALILTGGQSCSHQGPDIMAWMILVIISRLDIQRISLCWYIHHLAVAVKQHVMEQ